MSRAPILPGSTIGIVGGGQLGRMFALEARRMAYRVVVLDPSEDSPAAQVADRHVRAPLDDLDGLRRLADWSDVVTLEWENADLEAVRSMETVAPVRPGAHVLQVAQHRVLEKEAARAAEVARKLATVKPPTRSLVAPADAAPAAPAPTPTPGAPSGSRSRRARKLSRALDIRGVPEGRPRRPRFTARERGLTASAIAS